MSDQDRYRIESEIQSGGFARVFRVFDRRLKRHVAFKRLKPDVWLSASARAQIQTEAEIIARFKHASIVVLHDVLELPEGFTLVMELVEGESLADRIQRDTPGAAEALAMGRLAAEALAYAHDFGVIHGDVKPGNILLPRDGGIKITDFGLARRVPELPVLDLEPGGLGATTRDEDIQGTPPYMSPEQVQGRELDGRSDVFSLCIVLFEVATGKRPFAGSFIEAANNVLHTEPPWEWAAAHGLDGPLGGGLAAILRRGLTKDLHARYASMRQLARDLETLLAGPATAATAPVRPPGFVGRQAELFRLRAALEAVASPGGGGQTWLLSGEAGVGKSTLAAELLRGAAAASVACGSSAFHEGRSGALALLDALAPVLAAGIQKPAGDGSPRAMLDELRAATLGAPGAPGRARPRSRPLPEVLPEALRVAGDHGPFLVVLEDLHEASADALAALRPAVRLAVRARGLVLLTYRSEEGLASSGESLLRNFVMWARAEGLAQEVALGRLAPDETRALVAELLPSGAVVDDALAAYVQRETDGNPLFVRETVRYLLQSGAFGSGSTRLPVATPTGAIPGRIRDLLERRLVALAPDARRVLQAAAVEGDVFHSAFVADLLGVGRDRVLESLERLAREHELVVASLAEYRFRHAKVREVALAMMLPEACADLHGRAADLLVDSPPLRPAAIARHLVAAGRWREALPHLLATAKEAKARAATEEARELHALAVEAFERAGDVRPQAYWQAALELGRLQQTTGRKRQAEATLRRLAEAPGAPDGVRASAVYGVAWIELQSGALAGARRGLLRALALFRRAGDARWMAGCRDALGVLHRHRGEPRKALVEARKALAARRRLRFAWGVAISQSNLGLVHCALGEYRKALGCFEASRRYFARHERGSESLRQLAAAVANIGVAQEGLGHLEAAMQAYLEAGRIQREAGDQERESVNLVNLAGVRAAIGLRASALEDYRAAELAAAERGQRALRAHALAGIGRLRAADLASLEGVGILESALLEARAAHDAEAEGQCAVDLAMARLARGDLEETERLLAGVRALARRGGVETLIARVEHAAGRLALARADPTGARGAFEKARYRLRRHPEPELEWRVLADLARAQAPGPAGRRRQAELRARALQRVRGLAATFTSPALREAYLRAPERLALFPTQGLPPDAAATRSTAWTR